MTKFGTAKILKKDLIGFVTLLSRLTQFTSPCVKESESFKIFKAFDLEILLLGIDSKGNLEV